MSGVLLDTCAFAWMLLGKEQISIDAQSAIDDAEDAVFVSAASFYEINQKVRLGKWDEMIPYADDLVSHSYLLSSQILPLDGQTCMAAGAMDWIHRDPFDRLMVMTASRSCRRTSISTASSLVSGERRIGSDRDCPRRGPSRRFCLSHRGATRATPSTCARRAGPWPFRAGAAATRTRSAACRPPPP